MRLRGPGDAQNTVKNTQERAGGRELWELAAVGSVGNGRGKRSEGGTNVQRTEELGTKWEKAKRMGVH